MSFTAIRVGVGRVVLVAGVLVLLFIPYLLWGTGLKTAHSQSVLRAQFAAEQKKAGATPVKAPIKKSLTQLQVAPTVADPAIGTPVGTIDIPTIGINMMVVEGTDEARLQEGPGHYPGTPLPGENGNAAIAGHRTTYLHPFYNLNELVPGDPIVVTTAQGAFRYSVTGTQVVSPNDVAVVAPTPTPTLTLTTCNPRYSASQRMVVHATLVASVLAHTTNPAPAPAAAAAAAGAKPAHHQASPSDPPKNWAAAILWGVVVAVGITAVWIGAVRTRRGTRAAVLVGGLAVWLGLVFFFFEALAPLLPASY